MTALALVPQTREWHEARRQGIGASDVPAIAGMSSYGTPLTVWEQKTGRAEPQPDNAQLEWGRRLEPVIAEAFSEHAGIPIRRRLREVRYREWPVLFAHLDRMTPEGPLEIKSAMTTRGWGETGSSEVPPHVGLQVQAQLVCSDRTRGFVAALIGYRDFRWYEIERDDALIEESLLPLLREFWALVETDTPPAPDGSESYGAFLRRLHPRDERPERPATPEESLIVARLLEARQVRAAAAQAEAELEQRVMDAIAADGGLIGDGWRISFRASRETDWAGIAAECGATPDLIAAHTKTDWRAVAKTYRPRAALIDAHSTFTGSRRFNVNVEEES